MKLYAVEITTMAVVAADSASDAYVITLDNRREIISDNEPSVFVDREVECIEELPSGWDGMCIPYGYDGNTRIKAILKEGC